MNRSMTFGLPRVLEVFLHTFFARRISKFGCVFLFLAMSISFSTRVVVAGDGDLDPTFGSGGKVVTDFSGRTDFGLAVALQADGKIVVAGDSRDAGNVAHSALARY